MSDYPVHTVECDPYWELISAVTDGEASAEEEALLQEHMDRCPSCAESFQFVALSSRSLTQLPAVEPPSHLRMAILGATTRRESLLTRARGSFGLRLGFGLSAAAALVAYFALHSAQEGPRVARGGLEQPIVTHPAPMAATDGSNVEVAQAPSERAGAIHSVARRTDSRGPAMKLATNQPFPEPRMGRVGSSVLLAQVPFDPSESDSGQKPARSFPSDEDLPMVAAEPMDETLGLETAAKSEVKEPVVVAAEPVKTILNEDNKKRITLGFAREDLKKRLAETSLHTESPGITLFKGKF